LTGSAIRRSPWRAGSAQQTSPSCSTTSMTFDVGLRPTIPSAWALGGCSGAPLLTFVEERGIFSWRLGGIIYESNSLILKASRADCLNADGNYQPVSRSDGLPSSLSAGVREGGGECLPLRPSLWSRPTPLRGYPATPPE
jgi:hypothetical protein